MPTGLWTICGQIVDNWRDDVNSLRRRTGCGFSFALVWEGGAWTRLTRRRRGLNMCLVYAGWRAVRNSA